LLPCTRVLQIFNLMQSHLSFLAIIFWATGIFFRKFLHMPIPWSVSPMFTSSSPKDLGLTLRSLIHYQLNFVEWETGSEVQSFTCRYPVFPAPHVKQAVFYPMDVLDTFVNNQMSVLSWTNFWIFYSIPLVCILVLCQYHVVFITVAL
jgi:hypothetical protein